MTISFARTSVLFLESMAAVREERNADAELLDVCASGAARSSAKMRAACLQAQADRASPLVLKAVVRAFSTALTEFRESIATPFGFSSMILFVLSSLLLPVVPWVRAILAAWLGDDDDDRFQDNHRDGDLEHHVIVLAGGGMDGSQGAYGGFPMRLGMRRRMAKMLKVGTNGSNGSVGRVSMNRSMDEVHTAHTACTDESPSYTAFNGEWGGNSGKRGGLREPYISEL